MYSKLRNLLFYLFTTIVLFGFFSFKLTQIPDGMTIDEAAFGYNAVLISQTLHDQNGRFLPVFVLSIDGKDWRQPVTQYFQVIYFKIFGASVFNLKFTSVIVAVVSTLLIFYLGKLLLGIRGAIISAGIFASIPILMMHAHMGLDNIMVIPFTTLWLIFLFLFKKTNILKFLVFAGISLGVGYYSYKGMRSAVPVWCVLTIIYLALDYLKSFSIYEFRKMFKPVVTFLLSILPFFLIIPLLEYKYAGAVLGLDPKRITSIYSYLYPYFSSFDPSFLFIKGDELLQHSIGVHGMLLLASLSLFVIGLYQAVKKKDFWIFLVFAFFAAPLLYGFVGSVHRASRLLYLLPIYSLICSLGCTWLILQKNKISRYLTIVILALVVFNYFDFIKYYWFGYAQDTKHIFYRFQEKEIYEKFADVVKINKLNPYIDTELLNEANPTQLFLRSLYFSKPIPKWSTDIELPLGSALLTPKNLEHLEKIDLQSSYAHIYIK